jgi:hypothetical protein
MKPKLGRLETVEVVVCDEASADRAVRMPREVRGGAVRPCEADALAVDRLLPHARRDLRDVDLGALGARGHLRWKNTKPTIKKS